MTTEQRFWAKVRKTSTCWIWVASKRHKGYGAFAYTQNGVTIQDRAHRYSWQIHKGDIPPGVCVLHNCPGGDNPACVNPAHLFLGSKADNNADMHLKGRARSGASKTPADLCHYRRGENHSNARLTQEQVQGLRDRRNQGASFSTLAREFGIGQTTAFKIVKGITWKL